MSDKDMNWKHYAGIGAVLLLAAAGGLSLLNQGVVWAGIPNRTTQNEQSLAAHAVRLEKLEGRLDALPRIEVTLETLSKQVSEIQADLKEHQKQTTIVRP